MSKFTPFLLLASLMFFSLQHEARGAGAKRNIIRVMQDIEMKCGRRPVSWKFEVLPPDSKKPVLVEQSAMRFPAFAKDKLGPFDIDPAYEGYTWRFRIKGKRCKGETTGVIEMQDNETGLYAPPPLLAKAPKK